MEKIKILEACHKPCKVYQDDIYTPIHVGRAVSRFKEEMAGMIGDDTGDNISEKNPMYCELTAQYWAWKNLHDVEYIGFCHYRRFFDIKITSEKVDRLLRNHDVIAQKKCFSFPVRMDFLFYITLDEFTILLMVIKKKYPDYEQTIIDYFRGNFLYPVNMLICRKQLFDQYAEWLFGILSECEKHMKPMPYTRARRALAYMGEYLMAAYMIHHHLKVHFVDVNGEPGVPKRKTFRHKCTAPLKKAVNKVYTHFFSREKTLEDWYDPAVLVGFKSDRISVQ
jgi:hypothetical protein